MPWKIKFVALGRARASDQHPETQALELRKFASDNGLQIVEEFTDHGVSGTKARRPALDKMVEDARHHRFDVVLVWGIGDLLPQSTP